MGVPNHRGPVGPRPKPLLTPRQLEMGPLVAREGLSNRAIAERLGISPATVRAAVSEMYRRVGVSSRLSFFVWWNERFPVGLAETDGCTRSFAAGSVARGVFE